MSEPLTAHVDDVVLSVRLLPARPAIGTVRVRVSGAEYCVGVALDPIEESIWIGPCTPEVRELVEPKAEELLADLIAQRCSALGEPFQVIPGDVRRDG